MLDDATVLEHDDKIDIVNRREAMGRDQGGAASHEFLDCFHDGGFSRGIERRGRFVEQQDRSVFQKSARDSDPLTLSYAKMPSAFANQARVPVWQSRG